MENQIPKPVKIGIVSCVIIVATFFAYTIFNKPEDVSSIPENPLTRSERRSIEKLEEKVAGIEIGINQTQSLDEKFDFYIEKGDLLVKLERLDQAETAYKEALKIKHD